MSFTTNTVVSDGVTTQYPVSFTNGIYDRQYIKVYVEDDVDGGGNQLERSFTWINDGLIELDIAAPSGKKVTIRRELNRNGPDVDYVDGAVLDEQNLNQSMDQLIGLIQEIFDGVGIEAFNRNLDMNGFKLTNLGAGVNNSDSVNVSQLTAAIQAASGLTTTNTLITEHTESGIDHTLATYLINDGKTHTLTEALALDHPLPTVVISDRGNGIFDRVLTADVTPNTYNIVQCTGDPLFSYKVRDKPYEIYADQWGVVADANLSTGVGTNNSPVLQHIFDTIESRTTLYLPNSGMAMEEPINLNSRRLFIDIVGLGNRTMFFANAVMPAMFELPKNGVDPHDNFASSTISRVWFNANAMAGMCLRGDTQFSTFRDCTFSDALLAGTEVDYGWDNTWDNCYWVRNFDGIRMPDGQCNQNTFIACKWGPHTRFGCWVQSSYCISFVNCVWEACEQAAVLAFAMNGLTFDTPYFDNNATTGVQFTNPNVLVEADVILQGGPGAATMATASPVRGFSMTSPLASITGVKPNHTLVYAVATDGMSLDASHKLSTETPSRLVTTYGSEDRNNLYSRNPGMKISTRSGFAAEDVFHIQNTVTGFHGQADMKIDNIDEINIAETDMATWTVITGVPDVSTFTQSTTKHSLGPKVNVYELDNGVSTGTSDAWGFTIDAADYPGLQGKDMLLVVDTKNETVGATSTVEISQGWFDTRTVDTWSRTLCIFKMPASGTFTVSVKKSGNTGKLFVAQPILCPLGSQYNTMFTD